MFSSTLATCPKALVNQRSLLTSDACKWIPPGHGGHQSKIHLLATGGGTVVLGATWSHGICDVKFENLPFLWVPRWNSICPRLPLQETFHHHIDSLQQSMEKPTQADPQTRCAPPRLPGGTLKQRSLQSRDSLQSSGDRTFYPFLAQTNLWPTSKKQGSGVAKDPM